MEREERYVFIMGDKLPTYYDVAITLFQVSTRRQGDQAQNALHAYQLALVDTWTKAFGTGHVMSRRGIINKLEKVCDRYYNEVYTKCNRKKPKHANESIPSIRSQNRLWRSKIINNTGDTNASLFNIGVDMDKLEGAEKVFYEDQKGDRKFRISEEIDKEYVKQKEQEWLQEKMEKEREEYELQGMEDDSVLDEDITKAATVDTNLNQSLNRSGLSRSTVSLESSSTQTEFVAVNYKPPRINERVCSDDAKAVCANLSSVVGLSVDRSRKAMQIVCTEYYKDDVYLSKKEAMQAVNKCSGGEPPSKKL